MSDLQIAFISTLRKVKAYLIAASGLPRMAVKRVTQKYLPRAILLSVGGPNSSGGPLATALQRLGYSVTVVSGQFPTRESPVAYGWKKLDVETEGPAILDYVRQFKPALICSDHRNFLLPTKAMLLNELGMVDFGDKSHRTSNDKIAFRTALDEAGAPNLPWAVLADLDTDTLEYPTVFKPARGTGSRGVQKISTPEQAAKFKQEMIERGEAGRWLMEGFIPGRQFDVEGVMRNGTCHVLSVTEEHYIEVNGHFPSGWFLFSPPVGEVLRSQLVEAAEVVLKASGVRAGAFHCEMRVAADGTIYPLDYSNRFGYPHLVSATADVDFLEAYLRTLMPDPFPEIRPSRNTVFQRYLPTAEERTRYRKLVAERPDVVLSAGFVGSVVGDVPMFGNVCLKLPDFPTLYALLENYNILPEKWEEYYSKQDVDT